MTILELLCIVCSAGWVIAIAAIALALFVGVAIKGQRTTPGVDLVCLLLILASVGGVTSCAAESRVCGAAEASNL